MGQRWLADHPEERVYEGVRNYDGKITRGQKDYLSEYRQ